MPAGHAYLARLPIPVSLHQNPEGHGTQSEMDALARRRLWVKIGHSKRTPFAGQ
jgi:hypothetical protein